MWRPAGQKRESSIVGICDGAPRHTDGAYTCAWEAQPAPTMLAHEHVIESRCDELARMLAVDKPPGTVIQFRFSSGPDPGWAIVANLVACDDTSQLHSEAARLHAMNIGFYTAQASALVYRRQALSIWARVPVRQNGDGANSGLSAFIPAALDEMGKHDIEAYDLDVICYFGRDDRWAGETLHEIYENAENALIDDYLVTRKPSALRLKSRNMDQWGRTFTLMLRLGASSMETTVMCSFTALRARRAGRKPISTSISNTSKTAALPTLSGCSNSGERGIICQSGILSSNC
ncbi:MAG TPA: hypothetical protein VFY40_06005 [Blastocatellia bacterium]|nr:hypothetical protein [Blastocatellia bacterium]